MKTLAIAAGAILVTLATTASAQVYWSRTYDNPYFANSNQECWNPGAGHFEQVRPGEYQGDLDFGRCRTIGGYYDNRYYDRYDRNVYRERREECWNPRAGHYEEVRRGERQDDLDYSRCRVYR